MAVPNPSDLRFDDAFLRQAAIDNHYVYRGETWTSLFRLLAERNVLDPNERVAGLLTHTRPLFSEDEPNLDHLTLTITPPGTERAVDLRWNPNRLHFTPYVSIERAFPSGSDERRSGRDGTFGVDGRSHPMFCSGCGKSLDSYMELTYCPGCGVRVATAESFVRAGELFGKVILGKKAFAIDHSLTEGEFDEVTTLVEVGDEEVRTIAARTIAEYPFNTFNPDKHRLDAATESLPTLLDQIRDLQWSAAEAVYCVVRASSSERKRTQLREVAAVVADTFRPSPSDRVETFGTVGQGSRRFQYRSLQIFEEFSETIPQVVRPSLPAVISTLERETEADHSSRTDVECNICGTDKAISSATLCQPAVEFVAAFSEIEPNAIRPAIPVLIDILNRESSDLPSQWALPQSSSRILLALSEWFPEDVASGLETYLAAAESGSLPIPPASTQVGGLFSSVRRTVGELLATLVIHGEVDPTVIADGLRSEDGPYLETMAIAAASIAETSPELLSEAISDLIALLDFEAYHYTNCGAAATALGRVDSTSAIQPLFQLYFDADDGESGTDVYIQERVSNALGRIENSPVRCAKCSDTGQSELACSSCGTDLSNYGMAERCPGCGAQIY